MGLSLRLSIRDRVRGAYRRSPALLLALVIEALILMLFLFIFPALETKDKRIPAIFGFDLDNGEPEQPTAPEQAEKRTGGAKAVAGKAPVPIPSPIPVPVPPTLPSADILWLTQRDYSAVNKAMRSAPSGDSAASGPNSGRSGGNDSRLAAGGGPRGEPLYEAEWYRRPTNAELDPYVPARTREGWGLVACRTIANYQVEDCQELGDFPRGSGLAGAVRQAAWQFRVRPPRIGGKSQVGAWVRIRIDYRTVNAEPKPGAGSDESEDR